MERQLGDQTIEMESITRKEYSLVIDGVIAIPESLTSAGFFDGLFDTILEYIETYNARAALSVTHKEYVDTDITEADGGEETT